jgi:putative colanic acid biosynthesis acetyltransferase WcaF
MGNTPPLDISGNRSARKWKTSEQLLRGIWAAAWLLFRFSPRPLWWWRVFLLRGFGAQIERGVHIHPTVLIEIPWNLQIGRFTAIGDRVILYNLGMLTIGARSTISQGAHLCGGTHDYMKSEFPLIKAAIFIGANVWICADAFVGPRVKVGDGAILGARSVVLRNVPRNTIVRGNPAKIVKRRAEIVPQDVNITT